MTSFKLDCVIELNGERSDRMVLRIDVDDLSGLKSGSGTFEMPRRFVGPALDSAENPLVRCQDGTFFEILITQFDVMSGFAKFVTRGALPFTDIKRA